MKPILFRYLMATLLSMSLLACGGEESAQSTSTPSDVFPITAMDGFTTVSPSSTATAQVDVRPFIRGGRGQERLTSVEPVQETCSDVTLNKNELVFDVEASSGQWCDYQYTVESDQADAPARAIMSVFSTNAGQLMLPPLSHPMSLTDASVTFDLQALLGSDWPEWYALSTQPVIVQGSENNLGSATSTGNTITYTPPENAGWNRIIYTLTDARNPGNDVVGSLYVTISESQNRPPLISKPKYDYNAENNNVTVAIGTPIDIDLSSFISEPDGQPWQVINVQSYVEMAYPKDASSVTNKVITYEPALVGEHIISYIVADHYGGYSSGLIKVTNSENEKSADWGSLTAAGSTYSAPLRYSDGVNSGYAVSAYWDNGVNNTLSGYTGPSGHAYCRSLGALPTEEQMQLLRGTHYQTGGGGALNKWPAQRAYLIQNGNGYQGYDIGTGTTSVYSPQVAYYVTCVINDNIQLQMLAREVVADGTEKTIARIHKPASTQVQLGKVTTSQSDDLSEAEVNLQLKGMGSPLEVTTMSNKAGTYRFDVTNTKDPTEVLSSPLIIYIGDVTQPVLTKKAGSTDSAGADDAALVSATFELEDVNGNPLANQLVNFEWTAQTLDGVTVTKPVTQALNGGKGTITGTTNPDGEIVVEAKSSRVMSDISVTVQYPQAANVNWGPDFVQPLPYTSSISATTDATADGSDTNTVTVTVTDAVGDPVQGEAITLTTTGSAKLSESSGTTNDQGQVIVTLTNTVAETVTVTVDYQGKKTANSRFMADLDTARIELHRFHNTTPSGTLANGSHLHRMWFKVIDAHNNRISNLPISISMTGSVVLNSAGYVNGDGDSSVGGSNSGGFYYYVTLKNTNAETVTVTATVDRTGDSVDVDATFVSDLSTARIELESSTPGTPGTGTTADGSSHHRMLFRVTDANGNLIKDEPISITTTGSAAIKTEAYNSAKTTFILDLTNTVAETVTVTATVDRTGHSVNVPATFVSDNTIDRIRLVSPYPTGSKIANNQDVLRLEYEVLDKSGNRMRGERLGITVSNHPTSVIGSYDSNGIFVVEIKTGRAGLMGISVFPRSDPDGPISVFVTAQWRWSIFGR